MVYYIIKDLKLFYFFRQNFEKVTSCGYQTGLTIAINPEPDDYLAPLLGSYGVNVSLIN